MPKSTKSQAIQDFREEHLGELKKSMAAAIKIRDDPDSTARDKNEAIKIIARLLGALTPEKVDSPKAAEAKDRIVLSAEEMADLDKVIADSLRIPL